VPAQSNPPPNAAAFPGRVVFVGAGPGAADLLTARAIGYLRRADVVVHDRLVSSEILDTLDPGVERIAVPDVVPPGADRGESIGLLLESQARRGRLVVRLKGGDPGVFARLAEELEPLRDAGIPVEFVPGVTAALAAAAAAGVPLTSRSAASSLTLVTGHEAEDKETACDFRSIATLPGTLAIYMGVEQAAHWSATLLAAGMPAATPVTIVSRCSWPDQRVATTTLERCAADIVHHAWRPPAMILVGAAAQASPQGPLAGRLVLVTRPAGQADELSALVRAAGGSCLHVPLVAILPPDSWTPLDAALERADSYDWIVLASVNGVRSFVSRLRAAGRDGRSLGTARLAAVGPATRRELAAAGLVADLAPDTFSSEGLVESFAGLPVRSRFLLVRAARGRELLRQELEARGHVVDEVAAYKSCPVDRLTDEERAAVEQSGVDWLVVTSPLIADTAVGIFGERLRRWRIASLSPVTTSALRRHGIAPDAEAATATMAGVVAAIAAAETGAPASSADSPQAGTS
jgi:uroporphyrinogen III methyltransferase/synthase